MERLTTRHNGVAVIKDKSKHKEAMERLARYEELEEQGKLKIQSCDVGDVIYLLVNDNNVGATRKYRPNFIEPHIIEKITTTKLFIQLQFENGCTFTIWDKDWNVYIGKNLFLTKAEAEKALEEMKGE